LTRFPLKCGGSKSEGKLCKTQVKRNNGQDGR
jgi:hypothetical protein